MQLILFKYYSQWKMFCGNLMFDIMFITFTCTNNTKLNVEHINQIYAISFIKNTKMDGNNEGLLCIGRMIDLYGRDYIIRTNMVIYKQDQININIQTVSAL